MEAFRSRPQSTTRSLPIKVLIAVALSVIGCAARCPARRRRLSSRTDSIMGDTPPPRSAHDRMHRATAT